MRRRKTLWIHCAPFVLLVCAGVTFCLSGVLAPDGTSSVDRLRNRIASARLRLSMVALAPPVAKRGHLERLADVHALLETLPRAAGIGASRTVGTPSQWRGAQAVTLRDELEHRAEHLQLVRAIIVDAKRKRVLDGPAMGRVDAPTLVVARTLANHFCARAVLGWERSPAAAVADLGTALDVARLSDDGSAVGAMISAAIDAIVLSAVAEVVRNEHEFPTPLARFVEKRMTLRDLQRRAAVAIDAELEHVDETILDAMARRPGRRTRATLAEIRKTVEGLLRAVDFVLSTPDEALVARRAGPIHKGLIEAAATRLHAQLALAVHRHKRQFRRWPADLTSAAKLLPEDVKVTPAVAHLYRYEPFDERCLLSRRGRPANARFPNCLLWEL